MGFLKADCRKTTAEEALEPLHFNYFPTIPRQEKTT